MNLKFCLNFLFNYRCCCYFKFVFLLFILLSVESWRAVGLSSEDDSLFSAESYDYDEAVLRINTTKTTSNLKKVFECKSDSQCADSNSICLQGNCVKVCTNSQYTSRCLYFHCDSKQLIQSSAKNSTQSLLEFYSIETNNHPLLDRYLARKKCSWILENVNFLHLSQEQQQKPIIQLNIERFSTQFANDYLYIFAGDSIYSPLIAALSGNQISSNEPSIDADNQYENSNSASNETDNQSKKAESIINVTLYNATSLYLLFKSDVTSAFSILNSFKSTVSTDENKPNGVSIKYKFSSPCPTLTNSNLTKNNEFNYFNLENSNCQTYLNLNTNTNQKCIGQNTSNCLLKSKLIETINHQQHSDETISTNQSLLYSNLRRAFHCSFEHKNYLYVVGGYSFSKSLSFISRLNLVDLKWEHDLDRKASTIVNRSNRKYFSNTNFNSRQLKLDLPQSRYAHSCALDPDDDHFYMFGGIKYDSDAPSQMSNKTTTNELWSYNLQTNKWILLNKAKSEAKSYALPIAVSGHSMHFVKKNQNLSSIFIFFGYSEYYGSTLNIIQEYNLRTKKWAIQNNHNINIGFGHASIYDKRTNNIYFYGGLISSSDIPRSLYFPFEVSDNLSKQPNNNRYLQSPLLSSNLYSFNLYHFEWIRLAKTTESCYMHSSVLYENKILFYGGICLEEDPKSQPSHLYTSNKIKLFDINENEWIQKFSLNTSDSETQKSFLQLNHRQRYAHSSFLSNDSIYIFAGFNGFFLDDLFKINLNFLPSPSQETLYRKKRQFKISREIEDDSISFLTESKDQYGQFYNYLEPDIRSSSSLVEKCQRYNTCQSCHLESDCVWNNKKCEYFTPFDLNELQFKNQNKSFLLHSKLSNAGTIYNKKPSCSQMCSDYDKCSTCTSASNINGQFQNECVWCASQKKCAPKKALQILFPFGECFNLISDRQQCEPETRSLTNNSSLCSMLHSNCSSCIRDERCGWCTKDIHGPDPFNTGYGSCMEGGHSGSLNENCGLYWYFSECPSCECNGHSTCVTNSNKCDRCSNNTAGEYCSECKRGYYGNAKNNGVCQVCDCGEQATECVSDTGYCRCNTKGVIGAKCDDCDSRYFGKPKLKDGTCYYNLSIDYQYTFNLNKESDRYYTRINFVNHPNKGGDEDIDFMVRCFRENALINISYVANYNLFDYDFDSDQPALSTFNERHWPMDFVENLTLFLNNMNNNENASIHPSSSSSPFSAQFLNKHFQFREIGVNTQENIPKYYFGPQSNQKVLLTRINCTSSEYKYTFSNRDLNYADKSRNLVFIVNVYDFQTPITIQIAFSCKSRIHLLQFFITFFCCLFFLLTIAFITWKTKQRFDRYRRQRQIVIQMEHMASRPFTRLFVDVTENAKKSLLENEFVSGEDAIKMEKGESKLRKSQKKLKKTESKKSKFYINKGAMDSEIELTKNDESTETSGSENKFKMMPIAVEPFSNNKTAIVTCLLKLPQGGQHTTPKGSSPFMLCSTFVQLGSSSSLITNSPVNEAEPLEDDDAEYENSNNLDKHVET